MHTHPRIREYVMVGANLPPPESNRVKKHVANAKKIMANAKKTCQITNQQMCQMRKVCKMGWKWPKQSHMATRGANQYRRVQQTNGGRPSKGLHSFGCAVVVKLGDDGIAQLWAGNKMLQTQVSIWANCANTCYFEKCESPLLPRE